MNMDGTFTIFLVIFSIAFISILVTIIFMAVRGIMQWNSNNNSPRMIVPAIIVSKRIDVNHYHNNSGGINGSTNSHTRYFVTFQVESGDRIELCMYGNEYGMLAEGDVGRLTFQGNRYLGFQRQ